MNNKTRTVTGSDYRMDTERLQSLKHQIAQATEPSISLREIHVLHHPQGRVVLFEIPPAPRGIPIAWKGHYYARAGESRTSLGLDKLDEIRQQTLQQDWTAQVITGATLADLDDVAVPKMSPLNPQYLSKKQNVFQKIAAFVEKFKGVGGVI